MSEVRFDDVDRDVIGNYWVDTSASGVKTVKCTVNGKKQIAARVLLDPGNNMVVDHINGDRLDNRRKNLRVCEQSENIRNRKRNKNCSSGFKGVEMPKGKGGKWRARIQAHGERFYLGSFDTPEMAHKAYCRAAKVLHGDFANFG